MNKIVDREHQSDTCVTRHIKKTNQSKSSMIIYIYILYIEREIEREKQTNNHVAQQEQSRGTRIGQHAPIIPLTKRILFLSDHFPS